MKNTKEPCVICENYMKGVKCQNDTCPVAMMKAENERMRKEISDLRLDMSYMIDPNAIGDRHEMGG